MFMGKGRVSQKSSAFAGCDDFFETADPLSNIGPIVFGRSCHVYMDIFGDHLPKNSSSSASSVHDCGKHRDWSRAGITQTICKLHLSCFKIPYEEKQYDP
jgi:hypothetical protein